MVLRGPVNAGKSSLFNCLVGHDRAIVAAEAGTTRDYVEAQVVWEGLALTLVDTAGIRTSKSEVEDVGIEMGARRAAHADLELLIYPGDFEGDIPPLGARQLRVISKSDLLHGATLPAGLSADTLQTSARSKEGIAELQSEILRLLTGGAHESAEGCVVTNERQRSRLESASVSMTRAADQISARAPSELVIVDLNATRQVLAEITGEQVGDEMLDELFARFCIGK